MSIKPQAVVFPFVFFLILMLSSAFKPSTQQRHTLKNRKKEYQVDNTTNLDFENRKNAYWIRLYFMLEKTSKDYESRSFETDVSMGILESTVFDFLTLTLNPILREPVMLFMRSFLFDVTLRTTTPILLQEDILDLNDSDSKIITSTKRRQTGFENIDLNHEETKDNFENISVNDKEVKDIVKHRRRDRKVVYGILRYLIVPIVMHSLVHSASSIISHDILHIGDQ